MIITTIFRENPVGTSWGMCEFREKNPKSNGVVNQFLSTCEDTLLNDDFINISLIFLSRGFVYSIQRYLTYHISTFPVLLKTILWVWVKLSSFTLIMQKSRRSTRKLKWISSVVKICGMRAWVWIIRFKWGGWGDLRSKLNRSVTPVTGSVRSQAVI